MNKDEFTRLVLNGLELQNSRTDKILRFGTPDLEESHRVILSMLSHDEWIARQQLLKETGFRKKRLTKHLKFLVEQEYVQKREDPQDPRKWQYRRLE